MPPTPPLWGWAGGYPSPLDPCPFDVGGGWNTLGYRLGHALARASDVDGDGLIDHLVASPREGVWGRGCGSGVVRVQYGDGGGSTLVSIDPLLPFTIAFGHDVAGIGDTDGDGYDDFAVSAFIEGGLGNAVYLFRGGPTLSGVLPPQSAVLLPSGAGDSFGAALAH